LLVNSGGSNGDPGDWFVDDIRVQIQLLADEISALGALSDVDHYRETAVRSIELKQRTIGRLRRFLPAIPTAGTSPQIWQT
jgi:hypothetical protein